MLLPARYLTTPQYSYFTGTMSEQILSQLESKLDKLISLCNTLEKDNATLRAKEESWVQERKRLIEKNDIARTRVEAMIHHLKNLETEP